METLLLPGMDGTGRLFAPLLRHLAPELGARAVAFPADRPLSYAQLEGELVVPRGPFAIVAESFSGPLGVRVAARSSNQVRALVLVASFVRSPSRLAKWMSWSMGSVLFRVTLPDAALRLALLGQDASSDELSEVRAALGLVNPAVLAGRLRELAEVDVREEFASSVVPILYVAGSRDRLVGAGVMAELKRLRPAMETCVLDAPHLVLQRRPAEAARVLSEFILSASCVRVPAIAAATPPP